MREVLTALRLVPSGGNYESMWARIAALSLDAEHLRKSRTEKGIRHFSDEELTEAVKHYLLRGGAPEARDQARWRNTYCTAEANS
jgi:hypothetical protein